MINKLKQKQIMKSNQLNKKDMKTKILDLKQINTVDLDTINGGNEHVWKIPPFVMESTY